MRFGICRLSRDSSPDFNVEIYVKAKSKEIMEIVFMGVGGVKFDCIANLCCVRGLIVIFYYVLLSSR